MSLKIKTHGGRCCGIKTIHGFEGAPTWKTASKRGRRWVGETDIYGRSVRSDYNWYHLARPVETYGERFDEYIRYIKEKRPAGLIEVTLLSDQLDGSNFDDDFEPNEDFAWRPYLDKHGFKLVSEFLNSNSANKVYVFHLAYCKE